MSESQISGKISAIVKTLDTCSKIYDESGQDLKLSPIFETVTHRIPILSSIFTEFRDQYELQQASLTRDLRKSLEDILDGCAEQAQQLRDIFEEVILVKDGDWRTRYVKASHLAGEGFSVENLLKVLTEHVRDAVSNLAEEPNLKRHRNRLDKLLQELGLLPPSLLEKGDGPVVRQTLVGKQFNNASDGQQFVFETMSGTQNFNFAIHSKDFDWEKTFGLLSIHNSRNSSTTQKVPKTATVSALDLNTPLFTVPLSKDPSFTGRTELLSQLTEGYRTYTRMAVVGWAGVGLREQGDCPNIVWIRAETRDLFTQSYANLAEQVRLDGWDDPERDTNELVYQWLLREESRSWLIVLDNVDNHGIFEETIEGQSSSTSRRALLTYLPDAAHISILVTSRNSAAALGLVSDPAYILDVPVMSQEEALQLLKIKLIHDKSTDQDRILLVEELYCLPLAITQAAAYIFKRRYKDVTRYLKQLKADKDHVLDNASADLRRDPFTPSQGHAANSVLRTWSISFEYIKQHNEKAAELLCLLSLLQGQDFPTDVLKDNKKDYDFEYEEMVQPLVEFALVREEEAKQGISIDTISVHRMIQSSVKHWLRTTDQLEHKQEQALKILATVFPNPEEPTQRLSCEYLVPHVHAALEYHFKTKAQHELCVALYFICAFTLRQTGRYADAMVDWQHGSNICKNHLHKDYSLARNVAVFLTLAYLDLGLFNEAEACARKALNDSIQELGETHALPIRLMASLSEALIQNGKFVEAKGWVERYLLNATSIYGSDNKLIWFGKFNLARICNGLGQHSQAEQILKENKYQPESATRETHLRVATNIELSQSLLCQAKVLEAETLLKEMMATIADVFGRNYHKHSIARCNLATTYFMKGDLKAAVEICDSILPDLIEKHGPNFYIVLNIKELRIISSIGYLDRMEAVAELEELQRVRKAELRMSDVHPDVLLSSLNIGAVLALAGKYIEALVIIEIVSKQLTQVMGEDHYYTLLASTHLASLCQVTNDTARAEKLSIMVIERTERTLGSHNSVATVAKQVLANIYASQGKSEMQEN